jgi:hypothetical protein
MRYSRGIFPLMAIFALAAFIGLSAQLLGSGTATAQIDPEGTVEVEKHVTTADCPETDADGCVLAPGQTGVFRIHVTITLGWDDWIETSFFDDMPEGFIVGNVWVEEADIWACADTPGANDISCNVFEFPDSCNGDCVSEYDVFIEFTAPDNCGSVDYVNWATVIAREFGFNDTNFIGTGSDSLTVTVTGEDCPVEPEPEEPAPDDGDADGDGIPDNAENVNINTNNNNNNNTNTNTSTNTNTNDIDININ